MKYLLIFLVMLIFLSRAGPINYRELFTDEPVVVNTVRLCDGSLTFTGDNFTTADIFFFDKDMAYIDLKENRKDPNASLNIQGVLGEYCINWQEIVERIATNPECKDPSNDVNCKLSEAHETLSDLFLYISEALDDYVRNDYYDTHLLSSEDVHDLEQFVKDLESRRNDPRVWEESRTQMLADLKRNLAKAASKLPHKINKSNSKCSLFDRNLNGNCICYEMFKPKPVHPCFSTTTATTTAKSIVHEFPTADPTQNGEPGCRTCVDPNIANPVVCMQGTMCSPVKQDPADINSCHSLNTDSCTDGLIILNGKYEKFAPVQKTMCANGTYTINNKLVESIACADKFSPQGRPVNTDMPTTLTEPVISEPAEDCIALAACYCKRASTKGLGQLAIVNKNGTKFLKVESLRFDQNTGDWIYRRKLNNGSKVWSKFDEGRTARCVSPRVFNTTTVDPTQNGKPGRDSKCPLFHENHDGFCKWTEPDSSCGKLRHHNSNKEWVDVQRGYNSIPYQYNDKVDFAVVRNGCYMTIWAHPADIERDQHEHNVILLKNKLPMGEYNIPYSDVDKNHPGFDSRMNPSATSCNCTNLAFN